MSEQDIYRTIEKTAEGVFRDRGSKFLAFAYPVHTLKQINSILGDLRKKYHAASHHCYAYRLGASKEEYRANDDGEPSNSAGKPILGQIQSQDLSNILIVVVRYFGGTLLGVGGLINAYRSASSDAIKNARIITGMESNLIIIRFPYSLTNEIMRLIDEEKMKVSEQEFTDNCRLNALLRRSRTKHVLERINKLENASAEIKDSITDPE